MPLEQPMLFERLIAESSQYLAEGDFVNSERAFQRARSFPIEAMSVMRQRHYRSLLQLRERYREQLDEVASFVAHELAQDTDIWDELEFTPMDADIDVLDFEQLESTDGVAPESIRFDSFREEVLKAYQAANVAIPFEKLFDTKHHGYEVFKYDLEPEQALEELVRRCNSAPISSNSGAKTLSFKPKTPLSSSVQIVSDGPPHEGWQIHE